MKKGFKKNYKLILGVIIGVIISGIGVYAATTLSSSDISYDNSKSGLTSTNLNGAIDELYEKAKGLSSSKPCRVLKGTGEETSDEIKCGTEEFYVLSSSGDSISVLTKYPIEARAATLTSDIDGYVIKIDSSIESPSYAQNKNCGSQNFLCGGTGFSSEYKAVLNKIGLSDSVEVMKPSVSDLNKAGCSFSLNPRYDQDNGKCEALPWLEKIVLTTTMTGPSSAAVANYSGLDYLPAKTGSYLAGNEKLLVKIPIKEISK